MNILNRLSVFYHVVQNLSCSIIVFHLPLKLLNSLHHKFIVRQLVLDSLFFERFFLPLGLAVVLGVAFALPGLASDRKQKSSSSVADGWSP